MNKISGIYKITNQINGKIYIGQSNDIYRRWKEEKFYKGHCNNPLKRAFNKYGLENFDFEIIEECSIEELDEKEIYYISLYKSNEYEFGYNLTSGGGRCFFSDDVKKRMSMAHKGMKRTKEAIRKSAEFHKGRKRSEETRKKQSEAKNKQKKKVLCVETKIIYESIRDASRKTKITHSCISKCCLGKTKTCRGYHWEFI